MALPTPYAHPDGRNLHLGKSPAVIPAGTPKFHHYLDRVIAPAPPSMDWYKGVTDWGPMENDQLGCCTISSKAHALQVASLNTTGIVTLTDQEIVNYYSWWDGYIPGDPSTDNGGIVSQVLNSWHRHGMNGYKLPAYSSVDWTDTQNMLKAIELIGTVDIGLQLPLTAQEQVGRVWDVVGDPATDPASMPGSWGGHDINCGKYTTNSDGSILFTPITWGRSQQMTQKFLTTYADEVWATLIGMWFDPDKLSAGGFQWADLYSDMNQLKT